MIKKVIYVLLYFDQNEFKKKINNQDGSMRVEIADIKKILTSFENMYYIFEKIYFCVVKC